MSWSAVLILGGYVALVWQFGVVGLLAAVAHIAILALFVKR